MSIGLPEMVHGDGIRQYKQAQFGGYNHTPGAENGALWDMENLTGRLHPLLSPRPPRWKLRQLEQPNGLYAKDGLYWVDGTDFYAEGEKKGTVTQGKKQFAMMGKILVILPDKKCYDTEAGTMHPLEAEWSGQATLRDGSYAGESAKGNTLYAQGANWGSLFRPGDGVRLSGCETHPGNNQTVIIREIEGDELHFYENTFDTGETGDEETVTVCREAPEMEYICENENRLWGCKGDTIYASKLGDPYNWNVFDGTATDSYAVNTGSAGAFTGCCSYLGYPVFFKEERIYKAYGDRPSNYQIMGSASLGVEKGSGNSLAEAGGTLFYLSRTGITAYNGGTAQNAAAAFGTQRYRNAVGGSDGRRYYVSMEDTQGKWHIFVYDTETGLWHREDGRKIIGWGWKEELYFLDGEGALWLNGDARSVPENAQKEAAVHWSAEWADLYESSEYGTAIQEKKGVGKLLIRLELEEGAWAEVLIQYDSDGIWHKAKRLEAEKKRNYTLPLIPRRCDHYKLKLEGTGECRVYSLQREAYTGSAMESGTPGE